MSDRPTRTCGAGAAKGCMAGNILPGGRLSSVGTARFAVGTLTGNRAPTWFYMIGGGLRPKR